MKPKCIDKNSLFFEYLCFINLYSYKNLSSNFIKFINRAISNNQKIDNKIIKYMIYFKQKMFNYVKKL